MAGWLGSWVRWRKASALRGRFSIQWQFALPMVPIGMAIYYLAWKFFVGFLNAEVGIA